MNPSDFVKCYHGLTVTGRLGGTRTAQVYRYFMWGTKGLKKADEIKAKLEKDTLREGEVKRLASVAQASLKDGVIRRIFEGKGSPSDIKTLLEAALISEEVPDDTDSLQAFCDENIGVDCSGFVNAYFRTLNWIGEASSTWSGARGRTRPGSSPGTSSTGTRRCRRRASCSRHRTQGRSATSRSSTALPSRPATGSGR